MGNFVGNSHTIKDYQSHQFGVQDQIEFFGTHHFQSEIEQVQVVEKERRCPRWVGDIAQSSAGLILRSVHVHCESTARPVGIQAPNVLM